MRLTRFRLRLLYGPVTCVGLELSAVAFQMARDLAVEAHEFGGRAVSGLAWFDIRVARSDGWTCWVRGPVGVLWAVRTPGSGGQVCLAFDPGTFSVAVAVGWFGHSCLEWLVEFELSLLAFVLRDQATLEFDHRLSGCQSRVPALSEGSVVSAKRGHQSGYLEPVIWCYTFGV